MPPRKRLGQLLTELGVVDEHQLQSALGHQKQWGGKLGAVLVQKGFCKEADVVVALSKHLGMPAVKLADAKIDPRAVKFVSKQIAEKLHVFPYEISGSGRSEVVTIAMSDPTDLSAVDQLAFHTGKRIKPMLAGDSEIVHAIQEHYADEKKPAAEPAAGARPAAGAAAAPVVMPPQPTAEFPRRVAPPAAMTSAGGAPYIPPPIPAMASKPAQKLEEIEPDESMSVPVPPPPGPEPLDLPPDDGEMMGLEPIAAHSQFGEAVAGQEEVAGEGSAADDLEGLESASVPHENADLAAQMEELGPAGAPAQEPAPEGGWGAAASAEGWQAEASAEGATEGWQEEPPAEGASDGWTQEVPAALAADAPASDFGAAQDWNSAQQQAEGWGGAGQPAAQAGAAWGSGQGWGGEEPAGSAPAETPGEELPMDAIIGTAEAVEGAPDAPAAWGEGATAADQGQEQAASEAVPQEEARHEEPSHEQAADEEVAFEEPAFEEPVFEETAHEEPAHEEPAHEEPAHEEPAHEEPAHEEPAHEDPAHEDPAHEDPAHEEPAHEDAGAGRHPSAEAPDAWATSEDPLAAGSEVPAMGEAAPPEQAWGDPLAEPAADSAEPGHVIAPKTDKFAPVAAAPEAEEAPAAAEIEAPPEWGEAPAAESPEAAPTEEFAAPGEEFAAPEEPDAPGKVSVPPTEEHAALDGHEEPSAEAPAADEFSEQGELKIEGWVAPPAEPEPQGAGWFGQALEATTPLSAADLGALASVGVDPNDGVGALRLLATLVRVLHRHQLLDPDEVADEVRESRAQASAERAAAESDASGVASADGPGSSAAEQAPPEEPAET